MESGISKDYLIELQKLYEDRLVPRIRSGNPETNLLIIDTNEMDQQEVFEKVHEDVLSVKSGRKVTA